MRQLFGVLMCILVTGCISTSVQRLDQTVRPARLPDSVTVLLEKPHQSYHVIAVIEVNGKTVFDSFEDLRGAMVAKAAELGGEAVILMSQSSDPEFVFTGNAMIESDQRKMLAQVIVLERGR